MKAGVDDEDDEAYRAPNMPWVEEAGGVVLATAKTVGSGKFVFSQTMVSSTYLDHAPLFGSRPQLFPTLHKPMSYEIPPSWRSRFLLASAGCRDGTGGCTSSLPRTVFIVISIAKVSFAVIVLVAFGRDDMEVFVSKAPIDSELNSQSRDVAVGGVAEPVTLSNSEQELAKGTSGFGALDAMKDLAAETVSDRGAPPLDGGCELLLISVAKTCKTKGHSLGVDDRKDIDVHVSIRRSAFLHHDVFDNAGKVGL